MRIVPFLIDGVSRDASDGGTFDRHDPVTGEPASRAAAATVADADRACKAAARALPDWAALAPQQRRRLLLCAADAIEAAAANFADAMLEEVASTAANAARNVALAADALREAAALTTKIEGHIIPSDRPGCVSMAVRKPAGVVLAMAPWNAPVVLGTRAVAAPLACGNTVVFKSSELCPATHRLIGDVLAAAGLPAGVVNVISHRRSDAPAIVAALVAHPAIRRVNFTGSTQVGRRIAELCAHHLKPALLELGGKSPLLVLDDADLDAAMRATAFGAFTNQGQICMSTERVIVEAGIADRFVDRLVHHVQALRVGDPRDRANHLSGLAQPEAIARIGDLVDEAVTAGAVLRCGGALQGVFMAPMVVDHVTPRMRLFHEETFGPVVAITRARDDDHAVALANDSAFGLAAAVYGRDAQRAMRVAERIDSGICHVNGPTVHNEAQAPFGGVKASGYGRFGGPSEIDAFTELRWITTSSQQPAYPF